MNNCRQIKCQFIEKNNKYILVNMVIVHKMSDHFRRSQTNFFYSVAILYFPYYGMTLMAVQNDTYFDFMVKLISDRLESH